MKPRTLASIGPLAAIDRQLPLARIGPSPGFRQTDQLPPLVPRIGSLSMSFP
jgi:hypothetical protein